MIITHHKGECIKINSGDTTLVFNPVSKKSSLPHTRFRADIAVVSLQHPDFNGVEEVARGGDVFAITGPGEYEVRNIFVKGLPSKSNYDGATRGGTVYSVHIEDMHVLFLGGLSRREDALPLLEDSESVDVLFVPVGDEGVLEASAAHALAVNFEAKIIIPIHYDGIGKKGALPTFLKEAGVEKQDAVEKLTIKRKDVEAATGNVVVLKA